MIRFISGTIFIMAEIFFDAYAPPIMVEIIDSHKHSIASTNWSIAFFSVVWLTWGAVFIDAAIEYLHRSKIMAAGFTLYSGICASFIIIELSKIGVTYDEYIHSIQLSNIDNVFQWFTGAALLIIGIEYICKYISNRRYDQSWNRKNRIVGAVMRCWHSYNNRCRKLSDS